VLTEALIAVEEAARIRARRLAQLEPSNAFQSRAVVRTTSRSGSVLNSWQTRARATLMVVDSMVESNCLRLVADALTYTRALLVTMAVENGLVGFQKLQTRPLAFAQQVSHRKSV
jgi:hypothetical protein